MSIRNISWRGKDRRCVGLTTLSLSSADCLEIWEPQLPGTAVAQWLRCCVTNQKDAVSIPAGVIGFFTYIKPFPSQYGPGVDSASSRNEYQEYFLGVKAAGA